MKNFVHFTFIISLLLVFSGCSKDDDDENKPMSSIRVKIHYDSEGESPEGQFMIFDLENNNIQNFEPHYRDAIGYYLIDTNRELVFPILDDELSSYESNESLGTVYYEDLPSRLLAKESCKVLLIIQLTNKPYSYTCKIIEWKKDIENKLELEKTFKRNPEKEHEYEVW